MPGLRVKHPNPELANSILRIPCPAKAPGGAAKYIQLVFDDEGCSLISEGVWAELTWAAQVQGMDIGLLVLNEVENPPELLLGGSVPPEVGRATYHLEQDALRQVAPAGVIARTVEHPINIVTRS